MVTQHWENGEKEKKRIRNRNHWVVACSEGVWQQILGRWKGPVEPLADAAALEQAKQGGQAANQMSLQHQLDLFCRRAVSETMQQLKADQVRVTIACMGSLHHRVFVIVFCSRLYCSTFAVFCLCMKCLALLIEHKCKCLAGHLRETTDVQAPCLC